MSGETSRKYNHTQEILTHIAGILIIIPLAPFICRFIPPIMMGSINVDLVVSFIIAIILVRLLLWLIKPLVLPAGILVVVVLAFNQLNGNYSFSSVVRDYRTLAYINWKVREEKQSDLLNVSPYLFENPSYSFAIEVTDGSKLHGIAAHSFSAVGVRVPLFFVVRAIALS